ncbi:MAG: hypothetical protein CL676_00790 [Bdellovibrionaceae bacterium]|nr:hypothetical protein [Pseudobdellovibrionaceae bacterium]|tara:strand:- start:173 stop:754 length:582 start_codon:yes stop_codon:yes gene_type:complete
MWTKRLKPILFLLFFSGTSASAEALLQSVDFVGYAGGYSLSGRTASNRSVSLSGFGSYSGQLEAGVGGHYRASAGINYLISNGFTGDTAWGFHFGMKYFPFSWNGVKENEFAGVSWSLVDQFRPFVGVTMKTLQFTTVLSSSYNGVGVSAGTHYTLTSQYYLSGEFQYNLLSGNNNNSLTEMSGLLGFGIRFR